MSALKAAIRMVVPAGKAAPSPKIGQVNRRKGIFSNTFQKSCRLGEEGVEIRVLLNWDPGHAYRVREVG